MMERARTGPIFAGLAVAVSGLLAALALVYTNAAGVDDAARNAEVQQATESALGVSSSTRFALGQALLFLEAGGVDEGALAILEADARSGLEELGRRVDTAAGRIQDADTALLEAHLAEVEAVAETFLGSIEAGDLAAAASIATSRLGPAMDALDASLLTERDQAAKSLAIARAETGRVGTAARFMVALGVPAIALIGLAIAARRRTRRITLQTELTKERDLNRSKDQLIANLSHELRTPLTGIYSAALTIEETGFDDVELAGELTEIIVDQAADLTRMVEDLLVTAQIDAGRLSMQRQTTDVGEQVDKVVREFRREVTIRVRDGSVMVDPTRLRQVLRNLISNADRYGGSHVAVTGRPAGGMYEVVVADDGPGVPAEMEPRLFTPFVHKDDQPLVTGSVGLGLSITKALVEQMGGSIRYERSKAMTLFRLELPVEADEAPKRVRPRVAAT